MRCPDIEAEVTFLSKENGGKSKPAWQNYRVDHDFGLPNTLNVALHEFIGCDQAEPGSTVESKIWFMSPDLQLGRLYRGFKFTVQEGSRVVAHGVITNIINSRLQADT